jgi:hypothetical protein
MRLRSESSERWLRGQVVWCDFRGIYQNGLGKERPGRIDSVDPERGSFVMPITTKDIGSPGARIKLRKRQWLKESYLLFLKGKWIDASRILHLMGRLDEKEEVRLEWEEKLIRPLRDRG